MRSLLRTLPTMLLAAAIAAGDLVASAEPQSQAATAESSQPRPDQDSKDPRALNLTLEEAVRTTARRNLGIELQRYDYKMAGESARGSVGIFDFFTFAQAERASSQQPTAATINASQSGRTLFNVGVDQLIPTGGQYRVGFDNVRQSSNSPFTTVNPAFSSGLNFAVDQPLLRNFGVDVTRRGINIARNTLGINKEAFRGVMINTVEAVEQAYLDLIYARQNLDVQLQSLVLARDQERITQIRIDVGASAPLDILQPRVAIATRDELVISAEAQIRAAEDRLRRLMNLDISEWDRPIIPTEGVTFEPLTIDMSAAVARAMELRPELRQLALTSDIREIQYDYARNQTLPQLDLGLSYGLGGLGGNSLERDPITGQPTGRRINGGYSDAIEQVLGFDFPSWRASLTFGLPVRNITRRAEAKRAELDLEQAKTEEASIRQGIALEVRQAARDIDTLAKQINATRTARDAAEKNLGAERKRYENGMTTNFNVLLIQQELSDARSRELAARVAYKKSVAAYHRAVGDLLEERGITVDEPVDVELPRSRFEDRDWLNSRTRMKRDGK